MAHVGITADGALFLASARRCGVDFDTTLTLGHQELIASPRSLQRAGLSARGRFADELLRELGATTVDALDASAFEDATITHDLNTPIGDGLEEQYSAVIDGGTLEHVFNFPVALANAMQMVRADGHLLLVTPANQQLGHGFYQFSPELFFRTLSDENGFEVEHLYLKDSRAGSRWWRVTDPADVGGRAVMNTSRVTYMYVQARRHRVTELFTADPQQSDYSARWEGGAAVAPRQRWRRGLESLTFHSRLDRLSRRIDPAQGVTGWDWRIPDRRYFDPTELP
jgi:hypothetical protein